MPTVSLQQLATRAEFSIYGIKDSRHSITDENIEAHLRAASGDYIEVVEPWVCRPIISWGENTVLHVCAIAAWNLRGVDGFDPEGVEFDALKQRYDAAQAHLDRIAEKQRPPIGLVDSTSEEVDEDGDPVERFPNAPRVLGYPKRTIVPW